MSVWKTIFFAALILMATLTVTMSCGDDDDDDTGDDDVGDDDIEDDDAADDDAADDDAADDDAADDDAADDDDDDVLTFGSSAFDDGDTMPTEYTCDAKAGNGISPPLEWANPPEGTVAYAVTMYDTDIDFGHWGIINIPADTFSLAEGISPGGALPGDAFEVLNDFGNVEYDGPCPPAGENHTYEITLWALSDVIPETPTKGWCIHSILPSLLAVAIITMVITVTYGG